MEKVKIVSNVAVITSSLAVVDIEKLNRFDREALTLRDEKGRAYFGITYHAGAASIDENGIVFGREFNGKASVTVMLLDSLAQAEIKTTIKETYYKVLKNLIAVEKQAKKALTALEKELAEVDSFIETEE